MYSALNFVATYHFCIFRAWIFHVFQDKNDKEDRERTQKEKQAYEAIERQAYKEAYKKRCQPRKEIKTKQKLMNNDKPHPFTTTLLAIVQNMKIRCYRKSDDT